MRSDPQNYSWLFDNIVSIIIGKSLWKKKICQYPVSVICPPNCEAYALWAVENFWEAAYYEVTTKVGGDESSMVSSLDGTASAKESEGAKEHEGAKESEEGGLVPEGGRGDDESDGPSGDQPASRTRPKYTTRNAKVKSNNRLAGVKVGGEGITRWAELIGLVKDDRKSDAERAASSTQEKPWVNFDAYYKVHWYESFGEGHEMPSKKLKRMQQEEPIDLIPDDMEDDMYDIDIGG
jgi:hypothetical protein